MWDIFVSWLPWLALASIVLALVSLLVIPILIVRVPARYFIATKRPRKPTALNGLFVVFRNLLALVLFLAGLAMLVTPGQGLLTLIAAVFVSDFPGKYRFERWLVCKPGVLKAINWVRQRYDRKPIVPPPC